MITVYFKLQIDDATEHEFRQLGLQHGIPSTVLPLEDGAIIPLDFKEALDNMGLSTGALYNLILTLRRS